MHLVAETNSAPYSSQTEVVTRLSRGARTEAKRNMDDTQGWSSRETQMLISLWSDESVQQKLSRTYRNKSIYEAISMKMSEKGYSRTWQQCQRKIKSLKMTYRRAKDNNGKSGRSRITCPFFEELDRVLGDKPSFVPGDGEVLDTASMAEDSMDVDGGLFLLVCTARFLAS